MAINDLLEVGKPAELQAALGLNPDVSANVGAIIVFAANVEYYLEQAIWHIQGHSPAGQRHETDSKPITDLIGLLRAEAAKMDEGSGRTLIRNWCDTADSAFQLRHDIAHGVSVGFPDSLLFMRNPQWKGEKRKRPPSTFWSDHYQLEMIRDVFAVLVRIIGALTKRSADDVATQRVTSALRSARSIAGEFASGHNPSFEKY